MELRACRESQAVLGMTTRINSATTPSWATSEPGEASPALGITTNKTEAVTREAAVTMRNLNCRLVTLVGRARPLPARRALTGLVLIGRVERHTMALLRRWRHLESRLPNISRERLRIMNKWLFWLWIFPGIPISIYLRNSVAWVVFLSVYAIIVAHLIEWRQETEPPASST
jgi:hypothetical protein